MISTSELIGGIPAYMVGLISAEILGHDAAADELVAALEDQARLRGVLARIEPAELELLETVWQLEGSVHWDLLVKIYRADLDGLRDRLGRLGRLGLIYQVGITGRDVAVLLPALQELLTDHFREAVPDTLEWRPAVSISLWDHIVMLNLIMANKLRCRAGMEPFKKGWQLLDEVLGDFMDVRAVYWELVDLRLLRSTQGTLEVVPGSASDLAISGEVRYQVWRFFRACREYNGLEYKASLLLDGPVSRRRLLRQLGFYLLDSFEGIDVDVLPVLLDEWLRLGVVEEADGWLRFAGAVGQAIGSGQLAQELHSYAEEVIVQPNMEILVPRDLDPVDHVSLGEIADLVRPDMASIYRITRESIQRAFAYGWDMANISAFLDRISRHHLPENVIQTVSGWALSRAKGRIMTGTFLFMDEDISLPGLQAVVPGVYEVRDEERLRKDLKRQGIDIQGLGADEIEEGEVSWGRALPLSFTEAKPAAVVQQPDGVYPFGMVSALPYGSRGVELFEQARKDKRPMIIFYPRRGYGEIQVKKIRPVYIYSTAGVTYVEAFCEDSGEGEVFNISKVRALFNL